MREADDAWNGRDVNFKKNTTTNKTSTKYMIDELLKDSTKQHPVRPTPSLLPGYRPFQVNNNEQQSSYDLILISIGFPKLLRDASARLFVLRDAGSRGADCKQDP